MKNKKLLITIIIYFILSVNLFAQEIKFQAEKMDIKDEGNLIIAYNSNTHIPKDNVNIISENVIYFLGTFNLDFSSSVKLSKYLVFIKSLWDLPNCFVGATLIKK